MAKLRARRCFLGATSSPRLPIHLCVFFSHPFTSSKSLLPRKNSPLATDLVSPLPATCKTRRQEGNKAAQMQTDAERELVPRPTSDLYISTYTDSPDLPHQSLSCSSCLHWHHIISRLANDKVANRYLSCPGPFLRQCRPPPGALQLHHSMWRTTACSLSCSCWLQEHTTSRVGRKERRQESLY